MDDNLKGTIDRLNSQALQYLGYAPENGVKVIDELMQLALPGDHQEPPYPLGLAQGYLTLGRLYLRLAENQRALKAFLDANFLFDQNHETDQAARARSFVGVTCGQMGDYAQALEHFFEALKGAQLCQDVILEAEIINDISYSYILIGQPELAIPHLTRCIQTLRNYDEPACLSWALDSLGTAYLKTGDLTRALECELESIELSIQREDWQDVAHYMLTAGSIYNALGEAGAAYHSFEQSLQVSREHHFVGDAGRALHLIGAFHLAHDQAQSALAALNEALTISEETSSLQLRLDCFRALSEAYEKTGDMRKALDCYRQFHSTSEALFNSEADRRIKNIQVLHQLDTVRKEAETFHAQAVALEQEVEEQKRIQARLERLARVDTLTGALNRRGFFEAGEQALEQARLKHTSLSVIMFDVDRFKDINDQRGHLIGDQVLAIMTERVRHELRVSDLLSRYGGEEFLILLPGVDDRQAFLMAERLRHVIGDHPFLTGQEMVRVTISLGCSSWNGDESLTVTDLVAWADQALYMAKEDGRNCSRSFSVEPPAAQTLLNR